MSINTVINTNVMALTSHRALTNVGNSLSKASERLSTGLRINRAADDAAGLAISEKMRSQIRGLDQAARNANDGISLIQTAEGALQETHEMMQRMRELVVQASSDALEKSDRDKIALELDELSKEINETASRTQFNTKQLIDGTWENKKLYIQVGANALQGLEFNIAGMSADSIGVNINSIGDVVRGTYNTSISDQKLGVDAVDGKYDKDALDALGVVSTTEEKYNMTVLGTGGKLTLSSPGQPESSITANADGSLTIVGDVFFKDTNNNIGKWTAADTDLTKDDLVGKTFTTDDKSKSITFSEKAGKIMATTTTYDYNAKGVDIPPQMGAPVEVNGVKLAVGADGTTVTTESSLYNSKGEEILKAGEELAVNTVYCDSSGVQLFKTGATDATDLTVYTADSTPTPLNYLVETPGGAPSNDGTAGTYHLKSDPGVIIEGNGSQLALHTNSAPVFEKIADGSLKEAGRTLEAGKTYYDAAGNNLFTMKDATTIVEYSSSNVKLEQPAKSIEVDLSSEFAGTGLKLDVTADGIKVSDVTANTLLYKDSTGAITQVAATDELKAGDYLDQTTGKTLFSVSQAADGTMSITKNNDVQQSAPLPVAFDDTTTTLTIGGMTLAGDGSNGVTSDGATGDLKVWNSGTGAFDDVAVTAGAITLTDSTVYYDATGKALFKTGVTDGNGDITIAEVYADAVTADTVGATTDTVKFGASETTPATGLAYDASATGSTVTIGTGADQVTLTGNAGGTAVILDGILYDSSGQIIADTTSSGSTEIQLEAGATYYDKDGNALFKTDGANEIDEIYTAATLDDGAGNTTQIFQTAAPATSDLLYEVKAANGNYASVTAYDAAGNSTVESILQPSEVTLSSNITISMDEGDLTVKSFGAHPNLVAKKASDGSDLVPPFSPTDKLTAGYDYYDSTTGQKLFGVNETGDLIDYTQKAGTPTEETFYTPETLVNFSIFENGLIQSCGEIEGFDNRSGTATLEDIVGKTIVDEIGGKEWKFNKLADGTITVTEGGANGSGITTPLTIKNPVEGKPNTDLGSFTSGLSLTTDTGGFSFSAGGQMSVTGTVTGTDKYGNEVEFTATDFADGKDGYYGFTFETKDGKVSFNEKGSEGKDADGNVIDTSGYVNIQAKSGHIVDTTKMNPEAKAAHDEFNKGLMSLQAEAEQNGEKLSEGKVISLLTGVMDAAIEIVSTQRAQLGAYQNRLEHTIKSLEISSENLTAAESRIRDTDMAKEMMNYTKSNILQQAAISMLAQANQMPQNILQLLR